MRRFTTSLFLCCLLVTLTYCEPSEKIIKWSRLVPAQKFDARPHYDRISGALGANNEVRETLRSAWKLFKLNFKREYNSFVEEIGRFAVFSANFLKMMAHNVAYKMGKESYEMGVNEFSDKTNEELGYLRGLKISGKSTNTASYNVRNPYDLPESVDWRREGAVTPVKNQGHCGSCWAFSTTGAIEGQHFRKTQTLLNLSEQQLVDCSLEFGNQGCQGGLMDNAFNYVKEFGIESEDSYPYVSGDTGEANDNCTYSKSKTIATVTGFVDIQSRDEDALREAVANRGPLSIAINAGLETFLMYKSGVYSDPECHDSAQDLNHGVLLVGYGNDGGVPYWIVKNSWGEQWGEKGYIRMKMGSNLCGVATAASYPLV